MSGRRNWKKVETENRVRQGGREDVDGRWADPDRGDRKAAGGARRPQLDPDRQALADYIHALARSDVRGAAPPPVPKGVLRVLGLQANQADAMRWLRGHRQYASAHRKATAEAVIEPKGATPCRTRS